MFQVTSWFREYGETVRREISNLTQNRVEVITDPPSGLGGDSCFYSKMTGGEIWVGVSADETGLSVIVKPKGDGANVWSANITNVSCVFSNALDFLSA